MDVIRTQIVPETCGDVVADAVTRMCVQHHLGVSCGARREVEEQWIVGGCGIHAGRLIGSVGHAGLETLPSGHRTSDHDLGPERRTGIRHLVRSGGSGGVRHDEGRLGRIDSVLDVTRHEE